MRAPAKIAILVIAFLVLCGCQIDQNQLPPAQACEGTARSYADLAAGGKELCDTQHLIASLSPTTVDARAGKGALFVPFRITERETRSYCFGDDDDERHKLSIRNEQGTEVLGLVAGQSCKQATLAAGAYSIRFEHERVGGVDTDPDVVHTRMIKDESGTTFRVDVNACPGCNFRNIYFPCHDALVGRGPSYTACGFSGNYAKAYFDHVVCQPESDYQTECYLDGNFDGATFTFGSYLNDRWNAMTFVLGTPSDAEPENPGSPRVPSSFVGTSFPRSFYAGPNLQGYFPRLVLRNTARLSGDAFDMTRFAIKNESTNLELDQNFAEPIQAAASFAGPPAFLLVKGSNADFSGQRIDFARVSLLPELVSGVRSLRNAKFDGADLLHIAPIRTADETYTWESASFAKARISDSVIDATNISGLNLEGATLTQTRFVVPTNSRLLAQNIRAGGATLDGVVFGSKTDTGTTTFGADLSGLRAEGAVVRDLFARNSVLARSRFAGATIDGLTATGSDLSGANFDVLKKFSRATMSYGLLRPFDVAAPGSPEPFVLRLADPGAAIDALVLIGGVVDTDFSNMSFTRANLSYATIDAKFADGRISGSTFANAVISKQAVFTRALIDNSQFNGAHIAAEFDAAMVKSSNLPGVTFVAANTTGTTFDGGDLSSAHFCGDGKYAATKFLRTGLAGLVMPIRGTTFPDAAVPLKPGEERCAGGISQVERNALVTSTANQCPDGSIPVMTDCRDDQWIPMSSSVSPTCCMPARGSACNPSVPGQPCVSDCQCASKKCVAGACGN